MNGTPRLRSAYPSTPPSYQKGQAQYGSSPRSPRLSSSTPSVALPAPLSTQAAPPAIPCNVVDAPSQRLIVLLCYTILNIWRFYDFSTLFSDESDAFWLFTKWVGIDTAFLYGLSALSIPWLEWSSSTFTALFIVHGTLNGMLMFRISVSIHAPSKQQHMLMCA